MMRALSLAFLGVAVLGPTGIALAGPPDAASTFAKESWSVTGWYCPVGCSTGVQLFLQASVGKSVAVSRTQLNASFLDQCDGETHLEFKSTSARNTLDELNKGVRPGRKLGYRNLRITADRPLLRADAFCRTGDTNLPIARFLSIEPDRLRLLFEEQSVIELR